MGPPAIGFERGADRCATRDGGGAKGASVASEREQGAVVVEPTGNGRAGSGDAGAAPVFRGVTALVLDAKWRLAIPAKHRDALADVAGQLVVTADPSRCLLLYPRASWEPIQSQLMALSSFDPQVRSLQRLLVGHADDVEVDAAGRILVPPALRRYANLDKRVMLVGQGRKLELWDEAQWEFQTAQAIALPPGGTPPDLAGFSL